MSKLSNQWIDIFRAGDHGDKGVFTESDIQQIADNYDPAKHEAPAVIGHPKTNGPAYGWVEKVRRTGGVLQAKLKDGVAPQFEEAVSSGLFKKRSISLYPKGANGYSLRHIGFLGAQPPEIKGLADIQFEQDAKDAVEIEFSEEQGMSDNNAQMTDQQFGDRFSKWLNELIGKKPEGKTFSEDDVKRIATEAAAAAVLPLQTKLNEQTTSFSEQQTAAQKSAAEGRAVAAIARVKSKGAWVPAFDKMGLPQLFSELASDMVTIEFGEGTAKASKTPLEILTNFMEEVKAIVPTAPVYTGQSVATTAAAAKVPGVNDSQRAPADPNSIQLDQAIKARMGEKNLSYGVAMQQVTAEKPELTVPGGASSGSV